MPAYAIREWRQEEKPKALPEQIIETIDSCEDVAKTAKSRLKKFLAEMGIQDILEMDYPLRKAYQNYLFSACQIQSADRYLLAYDRTKQADIRRRMKTLAGKNQCRWRLEETILFLPYHPDQELAMELDSVRNRSNMVWDFTKPCAWHVKEQVFTTLNEILSITKNSIQRRQRLTGLQYLYDFCTEQAIQDIEDMDLAQEQMFDAYLTEHAPSETYKHQMLVILNLCRKIVFLHNAQINWQANIWYLDGLRIAEHRLNRSSSVASVSFTEISHKENRRYAKEYLRRANAVCPVAAVQNRYSMMVRHYERLFPVLEALGVGLVAFSPMANGFLTGQYGRGAYFDPKTDYRAAMPQFTDEAVKQNAGLLRLLYDMAAEKDATPAQISLAWMLCKHPWIVPIPGTRKEERMKENAGAADVKLSLREVQALDDALAQMNISAVFGGTPVA
mgnify:CR=1 FL=1